MNPFIIAAIVSVAAFAIAHAIDANRDVMTVCQLSHSFETCHHALYR